jgi:hypothetical protein
MPPDDLLACKSNTYSQNGEDGVIAAIFDRIGTTTRTCCEFGAWDGVHLSNCRRLILDGWSALMIEGDAERFRELVSCYAGNPSVACVHRFVDDGPNSLDSIMREKGIGELDFLSIDIDGLDYEIFAALTVRPRVICVEVNAGHDPESKARFGRAVAQDNVGQPLRTFVETAEAKGYALACYTGNAFFVRRDAAGGSGLPLLTGRQAYEYFLARLSVPEREWLYLVNLGLVNPYFSFANPFLARGALGISLLRAFRLSLGPRLFQLLRMIRRGRRGGSPA